MERLIPLPGGTTLCVDEIGDPGAPLVVQLEGHMAQLISTPEAYCRRLADTGLRVVRVDNRDVGRSSRAAAPYVLDDMVRDVHELISVLGGPAVVCGRSMGGAIAQLLALDHPGDVTGLGLFFTFAKEPGQQSPPAEATPAPFTDRESFLAWEHASLPGIAGPAYPFPPGYIDALADEMWRRGVSWAGIERQRAAMARQAPWADRLAALDVPTVILHGTADPVVPVAAGRRLAELIGGSELVTVDGLGHTQPDALTDLFADRTLDLVRR